MKNRNLLWVTPVEISGAEPASGTAARTEARLCFGILDRFPILLSSTAILIVASLVPTPCNAAQSHETVGWRPTAVPLVNFSSDDGTGYGVRFNLFEYDGESVPYRRKYSAQAFATTKGKWVHRLLMDAPAYRPGHRLEVELVYEKEDFANYYGDLSDEAIDSRTREERTFSQAFPELKVKWIGELAGHWYLRAGGRISYNDITPNATNSILEELAPLGSEGGSLFQLTGALRYDTRDNYNNTRRGMLEEVLVGYGIGHGGDFNGANISFSHRHFLPLRHGLVFAHRVGVDWTVGDLPFYQELALGGSSTVRGVSSARDRGEARVLYNGELRWRGVQLWGGKQMYLGLVLFADGGQTFARDELPAAGEWRHGRGAGLRYHWHSTIVRADYGSSRNRTAIYITFSQVF